VDDVPRLVARERASLAIVDVGSAGSAAWSAALALQEVPELASTAVLLLPSIPAPTGDESDGLDLGWVSLIPKPFTAEQLTRAVSTAARETGEERVESEWLVEVLVVDDDPDSRRVAAKFLAEANVRVREAQDGESALVEMRSHPPDVLVLDLMMPVLDGFGVLATLRADPLLARIPVVVLTAKSLTEAERQFLSRSAVRVLQKGEHRLADVAALVLRAAMRAGRGNPPPNDAQAAVSAAVCRLAAG
jgi:CheY-like chemotaxis protein